MDRRFISSSNADISGRVWFMAKKGFAQVVGVGCIHGAQGLRHRSGWRFVVLEVR